MEGDIATLEVGGQLITSVRHGRQLIVYRLTVMDLNIMDYNVTVGVEVEVANRVEGVQ